MRVLWSLVNLLVCTQLVTCRDFYIGMFRRNDFLVAQDVVYKEPSPFGFVTASYGRLFKCPITYFRVVDRLGIGRGPITTIVRGGLRKRFINVRIKSAFKHPISVNIYVGCENKKPSTFRTTRTTTHITTTEAEEEETETVADGDATTDADGITTAAGDGDTATTGAGGGGETSPDGDGPTTAAAGTGATEPEGDPEP